MLGFLFVAFVLSYLIIAIVCAVRESKVTSPYHYAGVYSRFSAYMALAFSSMGLVFAIGPWLLLLLPDVNIDGEGASILLVGSLIGLLFFGIGVLIYGRAYKKCPRHMKKKCVSSMITTGFGVALKLGFWFVGSVWTLYGATASSGGAGFASYYYDNYGNEYFVFNVEGQHAILENRFNHQQIPVYLSNSEDGRCFDSAGNVYSPY